MKKINLTLIIWTLTGLAIMGITSLAQTRLTVDGNVLKINGQPARLVGYGDIGMLADTSFDYATFFRTLQSNRINMVRVWVNYHWANSLTPYQGNRKAKYNIEQPNEAFYTRLANFVREADQRHIIVQVCLFDANALETGRDDPRNQRWVNFPLNKDKNHNGYLTSRSKYFAVENQCPSNDKNKCIWSRVHAVLIDNVTARLGNFGNVIYEVMNEPDVSNTGASSAEVVAFHNAVISRLTTRLRAYSGSKVISVNADSSALKTLARNNTAVSLYSVHLSTNDGPAAADLNASKPVIVSNDGHCTQTVINYDRNNPNRKASCTGAVSSGATDQRARKTEELLQKVFPNRTRRDGRVHFDFLDKGLNGSSWPTTTDYNPRAGNLDRKVLDKLKDYTF